jgi:hypothetical protein
MRNPTLGGTSRRIVLRRMSFTAVAKMNVPGIVSRTIRSP